MEWNLELRRELSFATIKLCAVRIGNDIAVWIGGGEKPHIGCTVLAVPRASMLENGMISATSSVLNVTGHKDDVICRKAAEAFCVKYRTVTACTGGFHVDHMTADRIMEVIQAVDEMLEEI